MSAGTYDPFALEKPVLRLGEHGEWTLGDITESRQEKLAGLTGKFDSLKDAEDVRMSDLARVVGDLCEAATESSSGLSDKIVDLADETKHGEAALGARALGGVVAFIGEWLTSESAAGEG